MESAGSGRRATGDHGGQPDVVIVGAGFAGLSAAVRLVGRGARVLVLEARTRLGGRATSFADGASDEVVDNGQHVLVGCYSETLAFLDAIGANANLRVQPQLSVVMIDRGGRRSRLVCPSLPSPLHLLAGAMDWDALGWADRLSLLRMRTPLKLLRTPGRLAASPGETVESWLVRYGQTERVREMLWRPLTLAALNQPTDRVSAADFGRVLAEMFAGDSRASAVLLPSKPLESMYALPARQMIETSGGALRTGATAMVRVSGDRVAAVDAGGDSWTPRAVISAVPWFALSQLFDGRPAAIADVLDRADRTAASPIVTVNLWFDQRVLEDAWIGLPGRTMQWVFDKSAIWNGGASHLSLVSSGAEDIVRQSNERLIALAHEELLESIPAVRRARLLRGSVVRERQATFSLEPGQPARPSTETGVHGLFLAGDWIDTGLPATIEGAVRSGHRAAEAVARTLGLAAVSSTAH
jgi:squalene-associated FAD-dependent desaturase